MWAHASGHTGHILTRIIFSDGYWVPETQVSSFGRARENYWLFKGQV